MKYLRLPLCALASSTSEGVGARLSTYVHTNVLGRAGVFFRTSSGRGRAFPAARRVATSSLPLHHASRSSRPRASSSFPLSSQVFGVAAGAVRSAAAVVTLPRVSRHAEAAEGHAEAAEVIPHHAEAAEANVGGQVGNESYRVLPACRLRWFVFRCDEHRVHDTENVQILP